MRRLLSMAVLASVLLAAGAARAGEQTVTLTVENMTCASCPYIVSGAGRQQDRGLIQGQYGNRHIRRREGEHRHVDEGHDQRRLSLHRPEMSPTMDDCCAANSKGNASTTSPSSARARPVSLRPSLPPSKVRRSRSSGTA